MNVENEIQRLYYIVFDSETVIFDEKDRKVLSCPTEEEATKYIRENLNDVV